ncbi:MAG: signal peptidase I [Candidatus Zambryskibacteria bacterium]|nr:signal peptidase I [Candidatus Zambryskibacteria bacterium]
MKKISKIGYGVFIGIVVIIALAVFWSLLPIPGNIEIKIVQSGSMEPTIHTGAIVVIKPTEFYKEGDIVTFGKDTKTQVPTTHRITQVRVQDGVTYYTTKGDANEENDVKEVRKNEIIGKVLFNAPFAGYIIDFAKQPLGFALLIGLPALYIIYDETMKIVREVSRLRSKTIASQEKMKEKKENDTNENI